MEKTEAESVDDITAAIRKQPSIELPRRPKYFPKSRWMNPPVSRQVRNTPSVESRIPCRKTGRISATEVEKPPVNRMMVMAKCPMNSASS